ncbi:argininosuccinate lyase [Geoglobus acetivorans]|uniref:Argininosuccinate lyase n=1 Tax=Geoglobus acetivorans TaxID=565033 RepID=A0A0A7GBD5_GEOAI|nr:Argininosuccinate lyase [Geoglobus acetivorans]
MTVRSRLDKKMDEYALKLTTSMDFDENIFYYDILVDYAHVIMLEKRGIIDRDSARKIILALKKIESDGFSSLSKEYEDVHEAIEAKVIELAGENGKKMHTARSRNDEVATCLRLFARDKLTEIMAEILEIKSVLLKKSKKHLNDVMPGFTHLQYAQPTKLSHHLLAYHDMISRDFERFLEAFRRTNLSPLGSAAFSGTSFPVDRSLTSKLLGFDGIVENSMDAVATRDFLVECIFACTSLMISFSRICEEIILWSSEFGFVNLPDEFASSSSIMPQKKNPDTAEIIRAKAGKMIGNLTAAMTIYKALPFAYNRDFQEMNRLLFEVLDETLISARVMAGLLEKIEFRTDVLRAKSSKGFSLATDIANLLVMKGIPFRDAHRIVGELAKLEKDEIGAEELADVFEKFGLSLEIAPEELDMFGRPENAVEMKRSEGGTSEDNITGMIAKRLEKLKKDETVLMQIKSRIENSLNGLMEEVESFENEES